MLGDVEHSGPRIVAGVHELLSGVAMRLVVLELLLVARSQHVKLRWGGDTGQRGAERQVQAAVEIRWAGFEKLLSEDAGGFDEGRVVERDQRLQRRVRARPGDGAFLARR